jgi:hypothetical protein
VDEAERHFDSLRAVMEKRAGFDPFTSATYTDYVVVNR